MQREGKRTGSLFSMASITMSSCGRARSHAVREISMDETCDFIEVRISISEKVVSYGTHIGSSYMRDQGGKSTKTEIDSPKNDG